MVDGEGRLDGNAVAGLLEEIFGFEMTIARTVCAGCGAVAQIGASLAYTRAPGTVVCCADCGTALMRLVHGEGRYWIDLRGASCVEIPEWTR